MHIRLHPNSINKDGGVEISDVKKSTAVGKPCNSVSLVEHFIQMHHEYHCLRRTNGMRSQRLDPSVE